MRATTVRVDIFALIVGCRGSDGSAATVTHLIQVTQFTQPLRIEAKIVARSFIYLSVGITIVLPLQTIAILVANTIHTQGVSIVVGEVVDLVSTLQRDDVGQIALRFAAVCFHHERMVTRHGQHCQHADDAKCYHQFYQTEACYSCPQPPIFAKYEVVLHLRSSTVFFLP